MNHCDVRMRSYHVQFANYVPYASLPHVQICELVHVRLQTVCIVPSQIVNYVLLTHLAPVAVNRTVTTTAAILLGATRLWSLAMT
jgi:hypothetical protein